MATAGQWIEGMRLRTLPAATAPVLIGCGASSAMGHFSWLRGGLALGVALSLQLAVNFANDYSDGIRGTDTARSGPTRLTGAGLASPFQVMMATSVAFLLAGFFGTALIVVSQVWGLFALGAAAIIAAWFYTGGKRPYGYLGLGEIFVFVFFGLVATIGTTVTQSYQAPLPLWLLASGVGMSSCALLMINNLRDLAGDKQSGKNTLAVRIGPPAARAVFLIMLLAAAILAGIGIGLWPHFAHPTFAGGICAGIPMRVWSMAGIIGGILVLAAGTIFQPVRRGHSGTALIKVLRNTGLFTLAYGILVGGALALLPALMR